MTEVREVLREVVEPLRRRVDERLERYMSELGSDCPERLREAMSYSLMAGGKRLRPLLVLLACRACGGDVEAAMPAACAIEMVHTYSLIHDDLPAMDDDDLRRGRPTNHVVFGEALAILAGDALLTLAFEILARDVRPPELAAQCCVDLAAAAGAEGMVGGQVVDLESEGWEIGPEDQRAAVLERLESIHRRKTGRLLCAALILGGRIAGAEQETLRRLQDYGRCLGLAFQITDDLLDVLGETAKIGKKVGKDAEQNKLTYPALLGVEQSRARAADLIDQACGYVAALGSSARPLEALARFVLERDH